MQLHVQTSVDMKIISVPSVRALHATTPAPTAASDRLQQYITSFLGVTQRRLEDGAFAVAGPTAWKWEQSATQSPHVPKSVENIHFAITTWCFLCDKFSR